MLAFEEIKEYFDPYLAKLNPKGVLVEYLQYELLDSLFKLSGSENLSFIGGTAIRIMHNSERFSEDLDFDNFGLSIKEFKNLLNRVCHEMRLKGFGLEKRFLAKGTNYHCHIKFQDILFKLGLSSHQTEKIFISVDTQRKAKVFSPEVKALNKFGIFRNIAANPAGILLAQKLMAVLFRKREQGRDFYDASFLGGKAKPDYKYIKEMLDLNKEEFIQKLAKKCSKLNYKTLAQDVEPFLFKSDQKARVLGFKEHLPAIF